MSKYSDNKYGDRECNQAKEMLGIKHPDQPLHSGLERRIREVSKLHRSNPGLIFLDSSGFLGSDTLALLVAMWKETPEGMEWCHSE